MSLVFIEITWVFQLHWYCSWVHFHDWRAHSSIQSLVLSAYKAHRVKVVVVSCHSCNRHIMQGFMTSFPVHIMFTVHFFRRRYWKSEKTTGFFNRQIIELYILSGFSLTHTKTIQTQTTSRGFCNSWEGPNEICRLFFNILRKRSIKLFRIDMVFNKWTHKVWGIFVNDNCTQIPCGPAHEWSTTGSHSLTNCVDYFEFVRTRELLMKN